MPQFIQFGDWLPDLPAYQNQGVITANNVFPDAASYRSVPNLSAFSVNALGARCLGAFYAIDDSGNTYNIAGDASALYVMQSSTFIDATRAAGSGGAYGTLFSSGWAFAQFGNRVLAVNGYAAANDSVGDAVQELSLSTGVTQFHNLTGASGIEAATIAIVRDFVVLGNVRQNTSSSGAFAQRVRWCAINNPDSWTADAATLADHQDLVGDGGPILKVVGGEYGVIFQRRAIWRMTFVGSPLVFQFDNVQRNIGLIAARAAISYQNLVFFLADDGFYLFDGSTVVPIGRGRVDRTFLAEVNKSRYQYVNAMIHPEEKIVVWAYPAGSSDTPDRIIAYNWAFNRWSQINVTTETLATQISAGGALTFAAFDGTHALQRFAGSAMAATIETAVVQLFPDHRSTIHEVRPIAPGGASQSPGIQIAVGARDSFLVDVSYGAAVTPNATGFAPVRSSGRYQNIKLTTANNGSFLHIQGLEIEAVPDGVR